MTSAHYQQIANCPNGVIFKSIDPTANLSGDEKNIFLLVRFQRHPRVFVYGNGDNDKLQQHSTTPPHYQPTVEALSISTYSLESASTQLERDPKPDSAGVVDLTGDLNDEVRTESSTLSQNNHRKRQLIQSFSLYYLPQQHRRHDFTFRELFL
jgi:hypothetical protein